MKNEFNEYLENLPEDCLSRIQTTSFYVTEINAIFPETQDGEI